MSGAFTRTTVVTASGRRLDLLNPDPEQVSLGDIAHSLARLARFNGHTIGPLPVNVADHSRLVEQLLPVNAPPLLRLAALLHDAHEAYVGDVVRPLRAAMQDVLRHSHEMTWIDPINRIEHSVQAAIHQAVALPWPMPREWVEVIDTADTTALSIEGRMFLPDGDPPIPWPALDETELDIHVTQRRGFTVHNAEGAARLFRERAVHLLTARHDIPFLGTPIGDDAGDGNQAGRQ